MIDISVVIPTLNRCSFLCNAVVSLQNQVYPADGYEIIVVDNGSSDNTLQQIRELNRNSRTSVRYIYESRLGLHYARHAGVKAAKANLIVFTDDDATFDKKWLKAYFDAFYGHPEMVAAGGPVRPIWEKPPPQWLVEYMDGSKSFPIYSLMDPFDEFRISKNNVFFGVNMAVRRSVFERMGFHPELFGRRTIGNGESGLGNEIIEQGGLIGYVPEAVVYHHIPSSRMTISYIRQWAWHLGGAKMYERWRNRERRLPKLAKESVVIIVEHWRKWLGDLFVRQRRDRDAIDIQFQASLGWCRLMYILWMIANPRVQKMLDTRNFRP